MENLDPISFEILKNSLISIAEEMGVALRRTPLLNADLFPGDHDPEVLYRIGPLNS